MKDRTPGPLRPVRDAQGICGLMHPTRDGVAVAWFSGVHLPANGYVGEGLGRPEREANAKFIMTAWDVHNDLLEALEEAKEALEMAQGEWVVVTAAYAPYETHVLKAAVTAIDAAIAKARGGA